MLKLKLPFFARLTEPSHIHIARPVRRRSALTPQTRVERETKGEPSHCLCGA